MPPPRLAFLSPRSFRVGAPAVDLDGNEVGNEGYDAFAEALSCGGMPCLKLFDVDDDSLGHPALNSALESRSISLR